MKTAVSYLLWLTEENYDRRWPVVSQSCSTFAEVFSRQKSCEVVVVNNGTIVPDCLRQFQVMDLSKNYFDVAVHYVGMFYAKHVGASHFAYVYDDFTYECDRDDIFEDAVRFLTDEKADSMRLPNYVYGNRDFDTKFTPKSKNPDSVRHETGAGGKKFLQTHVRDQFFTANWYPNSRPMLWNSAHFEHNYAMIRKDHCVMQPFEGHMYKIADDLARKDLYKSSFLNGGICSTFSIETSERTKSPGNFEKTLVDITALQEECLKAWK